MMHLNALKPRQRLTLTCTLLLLLSVTGCATTTPNCPNVSPELPAPPLTSTPQPQQPYLKSAQENISKWRALLKATPLTPERP